MDKEMKDCSELLKSKTGHQNTNAHRGRYNSKNECQSKMNFVNKGKRSAYSHDIMAWWKTKELFSLQHLCEIIVYFYT
jgi:hypothetical protein